MDFIPIQRMLDRVRVGGEESDVVLFTELLYLGEMITKLIALGLVASVSDTRDNHKYNLTYELVRADGVGTWSRIINEILVGPVAQFYLEEAFNERKDLTEKKVGSWQHQSITLLHSCLKIIDTNTEELQNKVDGKKWFELFARLRNKTRGHGAPTGDMCNQMALLLKESIKTFLNNYSVFKRPWAYLHRNLSGKYRVSKFNDAAKDFDYLKSTTEISVPNGIYIIFDNILCCVELFQSNVDLNDFYLANGSFNKNNYELLSYITGNTIHLSSHDYLLPVTELPRSETHSLGLLDVKGEVFTNMPELVQDYVTREYLEDELLKILRNDRHPVITLLGRGGIGKTSLTLKVLNTLASEERYKVIVWLSARDIDLLEDGPKQVKPDITTLKEIVSEYWTLIDERVLKEKTERQIDLFARDLQSSKDYGGPILLVIDNFETVSNPLELYNWIDTYIRNPNKVLITTRHREFRGDFPIEVSGMSKDECNELAVTTSNRLGITQLLTDDFLEQLFNDSEGHPYVVKMILGERTKPDSPKSLERIISNREDILDALFERTYSLLSEGAKRVFFTLCSWRSTVAQLAIEAVLLRNNHGVNKIDPKRAIEELQRISFIDIIPSEVDGELFLHVPLAAFIFGKRKLAVSPLKTIIEADAPLLHFFGAAQKHDVRDGLEPRINRLFKNLSRSIEESKTTLEENLPMLEFISRHFSNGWLLIAKLFEEYGDSETSLINASKYYQRYLEFSKDNELIIQTWQKIADINEVLEDWLGHVSALVEKCSVQIIQFNEISDAANRVNLVLRKNLLDHYDEKFILIGKLTNIMEERISNANATDCSRLCWLLLNINENEKAKHFLNYGLEKDPYNEHCLKLKQRLL